MKTAQRDAMYERIKRHGKHLLAIFPNATERDPMSLCKKLRRLEAEARQFAERCCNGPDLNLTDEADSISDSILRKVNKLLGNRHEYQPKTGATCGCRSSRLFVFLPSGKPRARICDAYSSKHFSRQSTPNLSISRILLILGVFWLTDSMPSITTQP